MLKARISTQEQYLQCGQPKMTVLVCLEKIVFTMRNLKLLYSRVIKRMISTGTAVNLEHDTLIALNLPQAVIDLYKMPGSEGSIPIVKRAPERAKKLQYAPMNDVTYIPGACGISFISEIPAPGLDDYPFRGSIKLVNKVSPRIPFRVVC